jgi:DNA helicase II / ATP-dependent DNA helicase PcrA
MLKGAVHSSGEASRSPKRAKSLAFPAAKPMTSSGLERVVLQSTLSKHLLIEKRFFTVGDRKFCPAMSPIEPGIDPRETASVGQANGELLGAFADWPEAVLAGEVRDSPAPMTPPPHLAPLNPEQRRAAEHGGSPLLIVAGAGTGKTNTLAHRVAHLIVQGADPRRIMLVTFSRRAALEMTRRVERIAVHVLAGQARIVADALTWSGTFHAIGARLLREYAEHIGLERSFTIHDREDSADLINLVRHDLGLSKTQERFPAKATCLAIYSRAVNAEAALEQVLDSSFPWCLGWEAELKLLFGAYVEAKQRQNVLDYDDLLLYWAQMMQVEEIARDVGSRFDHVLVDEYQDTNRLQASILLSLKPEGKGLTVVGDDAQSIYSFRAATVRNILDFPNHFSPPAQIITLERNYRSTQPILVAANAVIALASERHQKTLRSDRSSAERPQLLSVRDEADQARYVAERVLEHREASIPLKQQAVLFRASHHSGPLEIELTRRNIPFVKFGGLKFLEAAHIKDVLALLRWAENLRDRVSGFRVIQILRGAGPATAARLLDCIVASSSATEALVDFRPPAACAEDWPAFTDTLKVIRSSTTGWPAEFDLACRWYAPHLERRYEDARMREADLRQLAQIASTYPNRQRFLTDLTLDPPSASSDEAGAPLLDEDYLILSTIHSAKGQEWKAVFVLNCVDGCIPSDLAVGSNSEIEEERRLLYVAMTRAKDHLHLIVPQRFYAHQQRGDGDRHMYAVRTRFIPDTITKHFEQCAWPRAVPEDGSRSKVPMKAVDIAARVKNRWL